MNNLPENFQPDENTDWDDISINYQLSEDFIEKYIDKINLAYISAFQILSENFIEKHFNKLDIYWISKYQNLSEEFIKKYAMQINFYALNKNYKISRTIKKKLCGKCFNPIKSKRLFFRKKCLLV